MIKKKDDLYSQNNNVTYQESLEQFYNSHNGEKASRKQLKELIQTMPEGIVLCVTMEGEDYV